MRRVILDVDAGTDDAMALMLLLFAEVTKKIKIEAITCVNGNTKVHHVVNNVVRLLEAAGRTDIPVYKGAEEPLILPETHPGHFHGVDGFGDLTYESKSDLSIVKEEIAAVAIGNLVMANPGQLSLLAVGPLTNIALAIKLFPKLGESLKEVYLMGGNYKAVGNVTRSAEFNFFVDPEAAYIVLEKVKAPIHIVPWETTMEAPLSMEWRHNVLAANPNPLVELITRAEKGVYPADQKDWLSCDAYLAAAFLYPEKVIAKQTAYHATIELQGTRTRGQVVLDHLRSVDDNVVIIETVNVEGFRNVLLGAASVKGYK